MYKILELSLSLLEDLGRVGYTDTNFYITYISFYLCYR